MILIIGEGRNDSKPTTGSSPPGTFDKSVAAPAATAAVVVQIYHHTYHTYEWSIVHTYEPSYIRMRCHTNILTDVHMSYSCTSYIMSNKLLFVNIE